MGSGIVALGFAALGFALALAWMSALRRRSGRAPPDAGPVELYLRELADAAPDPAHPYLAHGVTRDLKALLAARGGVRVRLLQPGDPGPSGAFVLEGSVRKDGGRLALSLRLRRGARLRLRFDRSVPLDEVAALQEAAAGAVVRALRA